MEGSGIDLEMNVDPRLPKRRDRGIGCIGSGFVMPDIHLVAYQRAGFRPVALASRTPEHARQAAALRGVPKVHDTWRQLIANPEVEILDIAFPPDQQLEIIREAAKQKHIKGILAQKPLAMNWHQAKEAVDACREAGVKLAVNSNMRYDQSMRALKTVLQRGFLGQPVIASIDMRAIPHWQPFLEACDRLTLLNMAFTTSMSSATSSGTPSG